MTKNDIVRQCGELIQKNADLKINLNAAVAQVQRLRGILEYAKETAEGVLAYGANSSIECAANRIIAAAEAAIKE